MSQIPPPPPAIIQPSPENRAALLGSPISIGQDNYNQNTSLARLVFRNRNNKKLFEFSIAQSRESEIEFIEIRSDRQEYDAENKIITATGNVEMRYARSVLRADRLEVNIEQRLAVGTGNVSLERGDQILRGQRAEYSFFLNRGTIFTASGVVYQPTFDRDTNFDSPENNSSIADRPLSDRLQKRQPLRRISTAEGYRFVIGAGDDIGLVDRSPLRSTSGGNINRLRFEADRIDFDATGWTAENLRITNDPFSPPELELRSATATYRTIDPLLSEVVTTNSRLVFDRSVSLPLLRNRFLIDRNPREAGIIGLGYDSDRRGGLFVERNFNLIQSSFLNFDLIPQYFLERSLSGSESGFFNFDNNNAPPPINENDNNNDGFFSPDNFGLRTRLTGNLGPRNSLNAITELTTLDLSDAGEKFKANLDIQRLIGPIARPHTLSLEYNYRDRLFNGSLGFQNVRSSYGVVLASPSYVLGNSNIFLNYQGSIQNIIADSDRIPIRNEFNRANLTRYQGALSLFRGFRLWQGQALPPTPDRGMRYTSKPILPFWQINTSLNGVTSLYSNGEDQSSIRANLGTIVQLGNLSRNFFDYSALNLNYSQGFLSNESPFFFDRFADTRTLTFKIGQQIFGPVIFSFGRTINLETGDTTITDYFLEYSRRTYKVILRYTSIPQPNNTTQGLGSLTLQISDFNWIGDPEPFDSTVTPVNQGVEQ